VVHIVTIVNLMVNGKFLCRVLVSSILACGLQVKFYRLTCHMKYIGLVCSGTVQ